MATLPEANEFSPGIVDLKTVLDIVAAHKGDREGIVTAIWNQYFKGHAGDQKDPAKRRKVQRTLSSNVLIGMKGYLLFDSVTDSLTDAGEALRAIRSEKERAAAFATHILKNCRGLEVLDAIRGMQRRGDAVSKDSLQAELEGAYAYDLPRATTHHTRLLQWLRKADVLPEKGYEIDEERVAVLAGATPEGRNEWQALTRSQQDFLRALKEMALLGDTGPFNVRDVIDQAQTMYGAAFKQDQQRAQILRPLEEGGWLVLSDVGSGRGGKSGKVAPSEKLMSASLESLAAGTDEGIPTDLKLLLGKHSLAEIEADLKSDDKHRKGIALELLAIRLAKAVSLTPIRLRERSQETGGAEVDLIAEGAHLHFSRWLFQCKNTGKVQLADLAKEIGMAVLLKGHVVVMVTTGGFASSVTRFASQVGATGALQVVLIDGAEVKRFLRQGQQALRDYLGTVAHQTMKLKRAQLDATVSEPAGPGGEPESK